MRIVKDILAEITRLRLKRNWSEYELAERSNLSQSTISTWYRKQQIPTLVTLEKVCMAFGISLSQFFAEHEEPIYLNDQQRELLDRWAALSEKQKTLFLELFLNIH